LTTPEDLAFAEFLMSTRWAEKGILLPTR
jgi:hypothetical protein